MTNKYQPCDTHINGPLKEKLAVYWSNNATPTREVTLAQTIKETTRIIDHFSQQFIQDAFDVALLTPALQLRVPVLSPDAQAAAAAVAHIDGVMNAFAQFANNQ